MCAVDVAIGVEGLGFDSRAGQSGHSVTNGPPPLQHSSELRCSDRGDGPRLCPDRGDGPRLCPDRGDCPRLCPDRGDGPRLCPDRGDGPRLCPDRGDGPRLCPDRGDGPRLSLHVSAQQRSWFTLRDQAGVDLIKAMLCNFLIVCKSVPSTLNTSLMRHGFSIMTYALPQDAQRGRLSRQEFVKLFEAIFPESDAVEFANHVFRTFDVNKDGI